MAELHLTVLDPAGLHARPAAQVVRTAGRFQSRITITSATGRPTSRASSPCSA